MTFKKQQAVQVVKNLYSPSKDTWKLLMEIYSDFLVIFRNNISVWPKYVDRKANILFLQSRDVLCFTLIRALYCAQSRDICTVLYFYKCTYCTVLRAGIYVLYCAVLWSLESNNRINKRRKSIRENTKQIECHKKAKAGKI